MLKRFILFCIAVFILQMLLVSGCCSDNCVAVKHEEKVPLLVYHHFVATELEVASAVTVTIDKFRNNLQFLKDQGYNCVSYEEVIAHYEFGDALPPKPFILHFDDGYLSNYELAFPVMKEFGAKATICIIGVSVGVTENITPHFNWKQAREMVESGLVSIQSHTYNLHRSEPKGVTRLEGESLEDYKGRLREDFTTINTLIEQNLGYKPFMLAYPNSVCTEVAEEVAFECGYTYTSASKECAEQISREKCKIYHCNIFSDTQIEKYFD